MEDWLSFFVAALSAIFLVVDPLLAVPTFISMTERSTRAEARGTAKRASLIGALLLSMVALFGNGLFQFLGLELSALRVAGGLLLMLTALDMLRGRVSECRCTKKEIEASKRDDIAIVPLATPLLAGPGAIATVMMLVSQGQSASSLLAVLAAIVVTFTLTYFILGLGDYIKGALRYSGLSLLQRVMGLLLAAMSVQFIAQGAKALLA